MITICKNGIFHKKEKVDLSRDISYRYLDRDVIVCPKMTFKDFLHVIDSSKPFKDFFEQYATNGITIQDLLDETNSIQEPNKNLKIDCLKIEPSDSGYHFCGIEKDTKEKISLSCTHLNHLSDIKFDTKDLFITLFDFISVVLKELTFYGTRENKDNFIKELFDILKKDEVEKSQWKNKQ